MRSHLVFATAALLAAPVVAAEPTYHDVVFFTDMRPILLRVHVTLDGKPLSTAWDECIGRVFKHLDTNGDGHLDKTEALRVPPAATLFSSGPSETPPFNQLDTNGDGKVTADELARYYRRFTGPFQVPGGPLRDTATYDYLLRVQAQEALLGARMGRGGNSDSLNDALFKLLDTNGDGKLSKAELAAAESVLMKRDRNDDEIITANEILQSGVGADSREDLFLAELELALVLRDYEVASGRGRRSGGPFWLVTPGESSADLAREMQRYVWQGNSALKKIGPRDIRLDEATFNTLDVDGDGFLDTEELARFARRDPDLELKVRLGKTAGVELVHRKAPLEANVRAGKDGTLILDLGGVRFDLRSIATAPAENKTVREAQRAEILAFFKEADVDKNGYLDMTEAMRHPYFRNTFKTMDRDSDGMLFEKEVVAYLDAYQEMQSLAAASCASISSAMEGKGLFELVDTNGDGRLSVRELRNVISLLTEFDRDSKGFLTKSDIPRCSTATFRTGPAAGGMDRIGYYNATRALAVRGRIRGQQQPPQPARGPAWFVKMDRNGDGDVSRREFIGTDEQFKAIDTDGDGLISVDEAEAFDKKARDKK